jgi:carbon monoxide dehydrogenase subunit G
MPATRLLATALWPISQALLDGPMASSHYVFRTHWRLPAPPDRVYAALADVESYPQWWPQVRSTRRIDDVSGEVTCRSLLPYDLTFLMHRDVEDAAAMTLRAHMEGDLAGTSQWTVMGDGPGAVAIFDEDVDVGIGLLRAAGRLFRPALRLNHHHMMRSGEKGLRHHLADGG